MNPEAPYSKRELDLKFEAVLDKLDDIHSQTSKTNGSVARAFNEISQLKMWRAYVVGATAVVVLVVLPVLGFLSLRVFEIGSAVSQAQAADSK